MTGPLDFFTTFRSGDILEPILGAAASLAACWARAAGVQALPVITAAAPMTPLRMMKDRRSMPAGTSVSARTAGGPMPSWGFDFVFIMFLGLGLLLRFGWSQVVPL